jgi:hypothetical protein
LIERASDNEGSVAIYELPLDMAHLLRGLSQRHKLNEEVGDAAAFEKLVERMAQSEHTGLLEIHTVSGAALLLMIAGRISNIYWETKEGVTFEKGEARHRLDRALAYGAEEVIISDFSRDMWRNRQTTPARLDARFIGPAPHGDTSQQVAVDRAVRQSVLDELHTEVPALLQAVFFDLMTGLILARKLRGTGAVRVGILSEKIPALTASVRDLVRLEGNDQLEFIHVTTGHVVIVVAVIVETQEGIAALADKSQPTALIEAALARASRSYLTRALKIKNTG